MYFFRLGFRQGFQGGRRVFRWFEAVGLYRVYWLVLAFPSLGVSRAGFRVLGVYGALRWFRG